MGRAEKAAGRLGQAWNLRCWNMPGQAEKWKGRGDCSRIVTAQAQKTHNGNRNPDGVKLTQAQVWIWSMDLIDWSIDRLITLVFDSRH